MFLILQPHSWWYTRCLLRWYFHYCIEFFFNFFTLTPIQIGQSLRLCDSLLFLFCFKWLDLFETEMQWILMVIDSNSVSCAANSFRYINDSMLQLVLANTTLWVCYKPLQRYVDIVLFLARNTVATYFTVLNCRQIPKEKMQIINSS